MSEYDTALRIYLALLARDPIPPQRFASLSERLETLAHLAFCAAAQFDGVSDQWEQQEEAARTSAAARWDLQVQGLLDPKKRFQFAVEDGNGLPTSQQGDLLAEAK